MDGRRNFTPDPDAESRWHPDDRGYDDRGYDDRRDDRGRDDRNWDDRSRDVRGGRDDAERGYGEDRGGYAPTRYADERDYDGGYRAPEQRGGRGFGGDALNYGDSPSGQFGAPASSGDLSGEFASRSRRSEALDRSALQRPVSGGGASGGAAAGLSSGATIPGAPSQGPAGQGLMGQGMPGPGAGAGAGGLGVTSPLGPGAEGFGSLGQGPGATGPISGGPMSGGPISAGPVSSGPAGAPPSAFAAPTALTSTVPAPQQYGQATDPGGAVYRSKRPGLAVVLALLTLLFEVPVLRLFLSAMTAKEIPAGGTLAGIFMIPALPMFALGLYGLIGGAAAAAPGVRPWLRTPLAYLPVALLLFMAAGLAAS